MKAIYCSWDIEQNLVIGDSWERRVVSKAEYAPSIISQYLTPI